MPDKIAPIIPINGLTPDTLEAVINSLPEPVFVKNEKLEYILANDAFCQLLDLPRPEIIGKTDEAFLTDTMAKYVNSRDKKVLMTGIPDVYDLVSPQKQPSKKKIILEVRKSLLKDSHNRRFVLGICHNVTDRVEAMEHAASDSRNRIDFLAAVSHEIRTPMTGILGILDLLADTELNEEQQELVQTALWSATGLHSMLDDLLDYTRLEADVIRPDFSNFNFIDMLKRSFKLCQQQAAHKQVLLEQSIAHNVPEYLYSDAARLQQIINYLYNSGIKLADGGGVKLAARVFANKKQMALELKLTISNALIPEERQKLLFAPFMEADTDLLRAYQGSGMGLSICHKLVQLMKGSISIESFEETGTQLTVQLPVREGQPTHEQEDSFPRADQPLTLLVVDDNPVNLTIIKKLFEKMGHKVVTTTAGQAAISLSKLQKFDLIFMDIEMPDLSGIETTQLLRAQQHAHDTFVPIVAMTAHAGPGFREKCLAAGMDDYVTKPVTKTQLSNVIANFQLRKL